MQRAEAGPYAPRTRRRFVRPAADDLARMLGALEREQDAERLYSFRRLINLERSLSRELSRSGAID